MNIQDTIKKLAAEYLDEIIEIRRHIHKYPEISFQEFETSSYIITKLEEFGIEYKSGYVKNPEKKVIALRAELDALPIKEKNEVSYKSTNENSHACGHDVHTASLLGTAKILNHLKDYFEGTVKLIFQPGEELLPGGAILMMQEGALDNPKPDLVIAQHVFPELPAGKLAFKDGIYMASSDEIYLTVNGKGGHAALTNERIDTVFIASKIIVNLKASLLQRNYTTVPTILAFGKVIANGATNVIPDKVIIEGTFRTLNENWRKEAHIKIKDIAQKIATDLGGTCEVVIKKGYPFLKNNEKYTLAAQQLAIDFLGKENVKKLKHRMTSEDFAYYSQNYPSVFYRLGVNNKEKNITAQLHTSNFDIDENAIETGMGFMAWLAVDFLNR